MKRKFLLLGCGMFLCFTCGIDTVPSGRANELRKALHYPGGQGGGVVNIDLGRIVLLFSAQAKQINYAHKRTKGTDRNTDLYLFPFTTISSGECQKLVKKFNTVSHGDYDFNLRCMSGKTPGLELTIAYNPKNVSVELREFDTISSSRGLEFRFHNTGLLQQIKDRSSGFMRVSLVKKKQLSLTVGMEVLIPVQSAYWA